MTLQLQPPAHSTSKTRTNGPSGEGGLNSIASPRVLHQVKVRHGRSVHSYIVWVKKPRTCCRLRISPPQREQSTVQLWANLMNILRFAKNVILERARFNRCNQLPEESTEEYITVLYQLIDLCEYGNFKDEMLRDRLVVGICDTLLSERL